MLAAAKAADPVASLHAHAGKGRRPAAKGKHPRGELKAQRDAAVAAAAALLVEYLADRVDELIEHLKVIDPEFLRRSGLADALDQHRSRMPAREKVQAEHAEAAAPSAAAACPPDDARSPSPPIAGPGDAGARRHDADAAGAISASA